MDDWASTIEGHQASFKEAMRSETRKYWKSVLHEQNIQFVRSVKDLAMKHTTRLQDIAKAISEAADESMSEKIIRDPEVLTSHLLQSVSQTLGESEFLLPSADSVGEGLSQISIEEITGIEAPGHQLRVSSNARGAKSESGENSESADDDFEPLTTEPDESGSSGDTTSQGDDAESETTQGPEKKVAPPANIIAPGNSGGRAAGSAVTPSLEYQTRGTIDWSEVDKQDFVVQTGPFANRTYYVLRCDLTRGGTCHHFFRSPLSEARAASHLQRPSPYNPPCHQLDDSPDWSSKDRAYSTREVFAKIGYRVIMPYSNVTIMGKTENARMAKENNTFVNKLGSVGGPIFEGQSWSDCDTTARSTTVGQSPINAGHLQKYQSGSKRT